MPFTRNETDIESFINMLPKDEVSHMLRVKLLVSCMSEKLKGLRRYTELSDEFHHFGDAAFYHDIGKAFVPDDILNKQGPLTNEETIVVCRHPEYASMLFKAIKSGAVKGVPQHLEGLAFEAAAYHHEWWNGGGYPNKMVGYSIPLIARVTSVCDAYDAITSNRPYREARDRSCASWELEKNAGTQFDPDLVNIFLSNIREITSILNTEN